MKLFVLIAVLAGGCATPGDTAKTAAPAARPAASEQRFVMAPELQSLIHVVSVRTWRESNGLLTLQVNLKNLTETTQHFDYCIKWYDENGAPMPAISQTYIPWMLMAHEYSLISATAPSPLAADVAIAFVPAASQQ